jgi:hypothetical protein
MDRRGTTVLSPAPITQAEKQDFFFVEQAPSTLNGHPDFGHEKGIIMLFQNFVVLWKIHMSKNIILPADARQDASNDTGCLCKFLQHVGATTGLKMKLKLLKTPKTKIADVAIVIQASNWAQNTC